MVSFSRLLRLDVDARPELSVPVPVAVVYVPDPDPDPDAEVVTEAGWEEVEAASESLVHIEVRPLCSPPQSVRPATPSAAHATHPHPHEPNTNFTIPGRVLPYRRGT
jgi:hypothetical protein